MLKTIPVHHVRLGMYIQSLGGRWIDLPFWRSSFLLNKSDDLELLLRSKVPDVVIDTDKGLDIELAAPSLVPETAPAPAPLPEKIDEPQLITKVSFDKELDRARQIQAKAKKAVTELYKEARMGKAIRVDAVAPLVDEINDSIDRNAGALLSIARLKSIDDYTYMHSVAVCALMTALGKQMHLDREEIQQLGLAGLLHDVGKMGIPLDILNKPGKLTDEEFAEVKKHPLQGWDILKKSKVQDEIALDVALHHHEKMDGSGYPENLNENSISLHARMGAVCDVYDAVTSDRCYKAGWSPADAIKRMAEWRVGHFDETVFKAFVKTVGIYPVGSLVRLSSGRLAVVMEQSLESLLTPTVKVFFSTSAQAPIPPKLLDLGKTQERIEGLEDATVWKFDLKKVIGL
jgi:putative nucleotidyltransferase with HDIG domain